MLKEHEGQIVFDEKHLFEPEITTIEGIGDRYKNLDVRLLVHIISDPSCWYETRYGSGRIHSSFANLNARERILSILEKKSITGNPKGYYVNKHKSDVKAEVNEHIKSVSFSFSSMSDVERHFSARGSKYGIVFFHDFLIDRGLKKVTYINDQDSLELRTLMFNSPHLIESYGKGYDMRWENEWRIQDSLKFEEDDIAFIIVPDDDYDSFLDDLSTLNMDPLWVLPASVFDNQIQYFLTLHTYEHSSWDQIEILGGMLVDIDMFPDPDEKELELIEDECGEWIEYICKAAVQNIYEKRYIQKFYEFIHKISDQYLDAPFLEGLSNIARNAGEPWQTHRDLMMHCYGKRFYIQRDRLNTWPFNERSTLPE